MLAEQLHADFVQAMKQRDVRKKEILSYVLAQIKNKQIDTQLSLTDDEVVQLIKKEIKSRKESIDYMHKAGKQEECLEEQAKIAVLEFYLPVMMDEAGLRSLVVSAIDALGIADLSKERGKLIGALMSSHKSVIDWAMLNDIISSLVS